MKRILIVDDHSIIRKTIQDILKDESYEIEEASNGLEALQLQKKKPFNLIITDIIMPKMEGIELIIKLKRDFPDVKIIAISGGKPYYLYIAKKLGTNHVFTIPFDQKELLETVKKLTHISTQ